MAYTNCGACGAKALVGATRCPRCQAPFVSYDVKGERVPTLNCPVCGVQRPAAIGACPNCLTSTTGASRVRLTRGLLLSGVAMAAILAVGYAVSRSRGGTPATMPATVTTGRAADSTQVLGAAGTAGTAGTTSTTGTAAGLDSSERKDPISPAPARVIASAPVGSSLKPAPAAGVADTSRWDDAIATTWVHMRAAPNRGSAVVRTIDSGQRVSLGPPTAGWRSVRIGADRGWVDPRLFVVAPARRP